MFDLVSHRARSFVLGAAELNSKLAYLNLAILFPGILQGIFWGLGNGGGTMVSGVLIEVFGLTNTFRAFAIAGTVVLAILILAQYSASLLEQRETARQEYELLSDSDGSRSEKPREVLKEPSEEQETTSKSKE